MYIDIYIRFILFGLQPHKHILGSTVLQLYAPAADTIDFTFIIYSDWFSLSSTIARWHHTILLDAIVANHVIFSIHRSTYIFFSQLTASIAPLAFNGSHINNGKAAANEKTKFSTQITNKLSHLCGTRQYAVDKWAIRLYFFFFIVILNCANCSLSANGNKNVEETIS